MQINVTEFRLKLYPRDFLKVRAFYEEYLGFSVSNEWDRDVNDRRAMFQVGPAILELLSPAKDTVSATDISLEISDVHGLWGKVKAYDNVITPLRDNDWGDTSFCVADPEGFEITFFTKHRQL